MDSATQQQYIQKKLLYKFDKKLDLVLSEYFKYVFDDGSSEDLTSRMPVPELLEEIRALEFMNFKYQTALKSSNKDLRVNEDVLQKEESKINEAKEQIRRLSQELKKAQIIKRNKIQFNEMGSILMQYGKNEEMDSKVSGIQREIKELEEKYEREMAVYTKRQRYMKASLSSLNMFLNQCDFKQAEKDQEGKPPMQAIKNNIQNNIQSNHQSYNHTSAMIAEDDGQIQ